MRTVIDGDILTYRIAWSCQNRKEDTLTPRHVCLDRLDSAIEGILEFTKPDTFQLYLTGGRTFRHDIYPEYKAKRPEKPTYYELCRDAMVRKWGAVITENIEADDAMSIEGWSDPDNVCIASIDKDMLQVPCWHYNFVKGDYFKQTELEAYRSYYAQILMGDSTDNIPGIHGIGPARAYAILARCQYVNDMAAACREAYQEKYPDDWFDRITLTEKLVMLLSTLEGTDFGSNNT